VLRLSPAQARRCLALKKYVLNATVPCYNSSHKRFRKVRSAQVAPSPLYSLSSPYPNVSSLPSLLGDQTLPPSLDPPPPTLRAPSSSSLPSPCNRCHRQLPVNQFHLSPKVPLSNALFVPPPPSLAPCTPWPSSTPCAR
jgi:hypothetical protein